MAAVRSVILAWLSEMAEDLVRDGVDAVAVADRISAVATSDADGFSSECLALMTIIGESATDVSDLDRLVIPLTPEDDTLAAMTVLLSLGLCVAAPRIAWPSQPAARAARSRLSQTGDDALAVASAMGGDGAALYEWLAAVISASVRVVSDIAANAVPVVRVTTPMSLPSTVLAYQLYGDAARAKGLVDIGRSTTPMLMPSAFEALER